MEQIVSGFVDIGAVLGSGVYALTLRGEIVYIGRARKVLARVYTHRRVWEANRMGRPLPRTRYGARSVKAMTFDGILVLPTPIQDLARVEAQMIAKYRPKHNVQLVPKGKVTLVEVGFDLSKMIPMKDTIPRRPL